MAWAFLFFARASVLAQLDSNVPPTIALTNPPSGTIYGGSAVVRLKASASDVDGTIAEVRFYEDTVLLGAVMQPPYSLNVTNRYNTDHLYPYYYYATATDNEGATSTSAPVKVVIAGETIPPLVSLSQPRDGEAFLVPTSVPMSALVMAYDGSEEPVRFFSGTNLIGTADAPPYTIVVSNLSVGQHRLTATYTDYHLNQGTSPEVRITVTPLALAAPVLLSDGRFRFTIIGLAPEYNFKVLFSTDLLVWSPLATNIATASSMNFTDAIPPNSTVRFYRVLQNLP